MQIYIYISFNEIPYAKICCVNFRLRNLNYILLASIIFLHILLGFAYRAASKHASLIGAILLILISNVKNASPQIQQPFSKANRFFYIFLHLFQGFQKQYQRCKTYVHVPHRNKLGHPPYKPQALNPQPSTLNPNPKP